MPELPEVETIRKTLREGGHHARESPEAPSVVGAAITRAHLLWERTLAAPGPDEFRARVKGQRILEVGRRGKYLILRLARDHLIFHLRMSGDVLVEPAGAPYATHHRLVLDLDGDLRLVFNDPRKFGRVWLLADPSPLLEPLGPEPLDPEFSAHDLFRRLQSRRRQLKPLLMDQAFVAGLGNIYTDEALHEAGLHPLRLSQEIEAEEAERLWRAIRRVLQEGIRRSGASIDWMYRGGDFQNHFRVYQRSGQPCFRCGTIIERILVGQRGTHFCPACQPPG